MLSATANRLRKSGASATTGANAKKGGQRPRNQSGAFDAVRAAVAVRGKRINRGREYEKPGFFRRNRSERGANLVARWPLVSNLNELGLLSPTSLTPSISSEV